MEEQKAKRADKKREVKETRKEGGFRFRHAFLIILVLLLLLSLFSHNQTDLNILAGGIDAPLKNWIGPAGANIAMSMLYMFGLAAYPLTVFLVACALRPLIPVPVRRRGYTGALIAVIAGTTVLFAMWPENFCHITEKIGLGHSGAPGSALSGGLLGQKIAAPENSASVGLLRGVIGSVGTLIVGTVLLITGGVFVFIADWLPLFQELKRRRESNSGREKKEKKAPKEKKTTSPAEEDEEEEEEKSEDELERERVKEDLRKQREELLAEDNEESDEELQPVPVPAPEPAEIPPPAIPPPAPITRKTTLSSYDNSSYVLPPLSLLQKAKPESTGGQDFVQQQKRVLQSTLDSFGVDATVTGAVVGPRVTRYEITPEPGVKVEKISALTNNIKMDLQAKSIRILAPIPGKNAVGVEVANPKSTAVSARAMMEADDWTNTRANIPIILGKDVTGKVEVADLAKSPHLMIAGSTGSGKSVCMNLIIMSLLYRFSPKELRLIMVDPKVVEFEIYKTLPHLITPIVNDAKRVPLALRWAINEMERRYQLLGKVGVRNLESFNTRKPEDEPLKDQDGNIIPETLPYIVILIDELADIMMIAKADVETSIARIAQKARAVGIHMILATQTPRKDIITGVIKANLPSRIAFRVGSNIDSRVILDKPGAENLLGQGDMLFLPPGCSDLERIQGAWVSDDEIKAVVNFVSDQGEQEFFDGVTVDKEEEAAAAPAGADAPLGSASPAISKYLKPDDDENMKRALEIVFTENKASTSYIQRRLKIGYNRAADIIDQLEERGIIGPQPSTGGANREILVDTEES
jgi:S-DNA-T family DNA segregation ATPase FtsK/SpoIIIE